ncbi:MAG: ABC transporter substrate-binding protein [Trueperaceae bacterium]|nr:ABC transporter substrate-binding protein [Trueperaceae bacterium]
MSSRLVRTVILALVAALLAVAAAQQTRVIVDRMGREVVVPVEINRVVTNWLPFPSAFFISTGSLDRLVAVGEGSIQTAGRSMLGRIAPDILTKETGFASGTGINAEALLALQPDLYISYESQPEIAEVERLGIPVIALDVLSVTGGNPIETFAGWMGVLGQLFDQEERTDEIIAYARNVLAETRAMVATVPEDDRPTALFFSRLEEGNLLINGAGHFGHFWATEAGARNVAPAGAPPLATVNMEEIYAANPEVLFISTFSSTQPEDLYENRVPGQDWSHVAAVQNGRVYKLPEGIFQWYPPSADAPLMMRWIAQQVHPELFTYDFAAELRDYYSRFYGYQLSDEEVQLILNPVF